MWHKKALMIDPKKTRLLFIKGGNLKPKQVPPWVQKRELSREVHELFPLV
jgi:hypothetical protein